MSIDKTGGQAFPCPGWVGERTGHAPVSGMTLRDYFAAKSMQALVSKYGNGEARICMEAYKIADAMIASRSKQ